MGNFKDINETKNLYDKYETYYIEEIFKKI